LDSEPAQVFGIAMLNRTIFALAAMLALAALCAPLAFAEEQQSAEQRRLFVEGAQLWPVYCAQCHNARPGSQFSPAQWDAITMHMRTQSIMPAKNMRAIKEFLKTAR
jgi:mono/diheme cytochrome c family protein